MENRVKNLVRPAIAGLQPYSTARDEYGGNTGIFLDANENPYESGVNRYPDPGQRALKERLAELKGCRPGQIFVGNGSDEAIDLCYRIFCEPRVDNAVSIAPTYGMYPVAAAVNDTAFRPVMLRDDFSVDTEALLAAADARTKLMLLCSPNNPTGNLIPRLQIEELLARFRGMVVLDEAYVDFSDGGSLLPSLDRYPNLIILQTLSKAWGMAGLRLGLALASEEVVALFSKVRYPYNIGAHTQQLALRMLERDITPQLDEIRAQRTWLADGLRRSPRVREVFPSQANFLLVRVDGAREVYEKLAGQGIVVRDRSGVKGCEGCLRITVGTPEENLRLIEAWSGL